MNKVMLSGRIASDIEVKNTPSGASVVNFSLAVNRRFKGSDGKFETDFINCVAWRVCADFIGKYFSKGKPIEIVGNIQTRTYEKDGNKVFVTEVHVDEASFVVANNNTSGTTEKTEKPDSFFEDEGFMTLGDDEPLPF